MHLPTPPAGSRRRTRRALIAAALPAAVAAFALPAAAHAGNLVVSNDGRLSYIDGSSQENNDVLLRVEGNEIVITDRAARVTSSSKACQVVNPNRAECPANLNVTVNTLGGSDQVQYRLPQAGGVQLGEGNDTLIAGTREATLQAIGRVTYFGGPDSDTITYAAADRGVSVTPEDGRDNDGRPGDRESVSPDFERFIGSGFRDAPLFGTPDADIMLGNGGDDQVAGGQGNDTFTSEGVDGADDYHGGPGTDTMNYSSRPQAVLVDLDNVADDGRLGENDNVRSNVENVFGGSGDDSIKSLGAHSLLLGGEGVDHLVGGFGPDTLIGGPEVDRLEGGTENDVIDSLDGEAENVDCGPGTGDTIRRDFDGFVGCETVLVGVLRLSPKAQRVEAGKAAHMRLSWRHPRAWRKLRKVELRLTRDDAPVGEITIRPRAERIAAEGEVELVRKRSRLTGKAKTVTAQLAVRLDDSLAGQTLKADVEATDTRGRRQLERDAGTVRIVLDKP
jgi:Ca2+-binding RTX toxin-like protein